MKKLLFLSLLFVCFINSFAQISGPTNPPVGVNVVYTFNNGSIYFGTSWVITNGSIINSSSSGTTYSATVQWTASGSGSLTFKAKTLVLSVLNVTICGAAVPTGSFTYTPECYNTHVPNNTTTISRLGTPPAGQTWYWQVNDPNGTSTAASGSSYSATPGSIMYLRGYENSSGCWSSSSLAAGIIPDRPTTTPGSSCVNSTVQLSASLGSNGTEVRWYNDCPGGSHVGTGTSFTTPVLSSTAFYYASSYNTTTGAESPRVRVVATIHAIPSPPSSARVSPSTVCISGSTSVMLSATGAGGGESYLWYTTETGGSSLGSTTQYVTSTTTFWVSKRTDATGCESSRISTTVTVNPLPVTFTVSGTGAYCASGSGLTVTLSGSQVNVNYQLKKGGVIEGALQSGTGGSLSWPNMTAGIYTVEATNTNGSCPVTMGGQATITSDPVSFGGSVGLNNTACTSASGTLTLTGHPMGTILRWEQNTGGGWTTISNTTTSQAYSVSVTTQYRAIVKSGTCPETPSSIATITVNPVPVVYSVSGTGSFCSSGSGLTVTLNGSQVNVNYQLKKGGVIEGAVLNGTGGALSWINKTAGIYTVEATNTNGSCLVTMSGQATITSNPVSVGGSVGPNNTACTSASGTLTLTGHTGSILRWEQNTGGGWTTISNTTASHPYSVSVTTQYRAIVKSGICSETPSSIATITVNPLPGLYTVSGTGSYCSSGSGLSVTLNGSQAGFKYQLKNGAADQGGQVTGTGSPLVWTNQPAGTYTVVATNTVNSCPRTMTNNAVITVIPASVGGIVTSTSQLSGGSLGPQGTLTLTGSTGTVLRWEYNNGSGWQTVPHSTPTTTYSYLKLPEARHYRAIVKSGICAEAASAPVKLAIHDLAYANTVQLTSDAASTYQWFKGGTIIAGATQQSYTANDQAVYTVKVNGNTNPQGVFYVYPTIANQTQKINAVSSTVILKAGVTETTSLYTLAPNELMQTIAYQDGLGRTFQNIGVGMSPTQTDVITPSGFGKQGLTDSTYLPFVSATRDGRYKKTAIRGSGFQYTTSDQYLFYQGTAKVASDTKPYARTLYRNTPDAKPTEQGAPGTDWQPGLNHTVRGVMALNNATNYRVRYWNVAGLTTANYADNSVVVNITTDENGNNVQTYTDARGLTVLKQVYINETLEGVATTWLETYYIYDEYGRIKYIVPPKAMKLLGTGASLDANNAAVAELIHKFTYDLLGRLVEKKVPGAAVQFIVYDKHDRIVLTQDGNLRSTNRWMFIKYDIYNRPVYTGIYTNTTQTTRPTVQTLLDNLNYATTPWYESEGSVHGYTNSAFPTTGTVANTILSVSYYDHYNFDRSGGDDFTYDAAHFAGQEATRSTATRGMATGSKRNVLDAAGNATTYWITSAVFYDKNDRPIQTQTNNHLHTAFTAPTLDKTTVIYDFVKPLKTKSTHYQNASTVVHLEDRSDYDHAGRVLKTYRKINTNPEQLLVQYEYNALGQVVDKKLHNTGGSTFLQSVDYRYNIRGWLTSINNAELNVNSSNNDETNDYFGLELAYNTVASGLSNTLYYNGNISAIKWKGAGMHYSGPLAENTDGQRSYKFTYDKSDRLTAATFAAKDNSTNWNKQVNTLNETMTYDVNGNIKTLTRNRNLRANSGITVNATPETFDNLTYTYASNLDKLTKVEDASSVQAGFLNGVNTTTEYAYDTDGSLTADNNKGVSSITYNMLGKPQVVNFTSGKKIEYIYDAAGTKLAMKTYQATTLLTSTNYSGSFVYEGSSPVLSFFGSPEGRVVKTGANFEYQYAIADHQGNTRVVFSSATPAPVAVTATMEAATNSDFQNYTNRVGFNLFDHTDAGTTFTYAQKLTGGNNAQVGLSKSYKVYAGDKVKIEAWAKYQNPTGTSSNLAGFASALFAAFGVPAPVGGETGTISSALNIWGGLVVGGSGGSNPSGPKAFINIIVFDKNYKLLDAAWEAVDPAANQVGATPVIAHDYLMREYTAKEEGYVFMYVSNESPTLVDVYFDDVVMTHTKGNLIQYNEYYPFGLTTANSWTREGSSNNELYNGSVELNTTTGLYETYFRGYDPALGRFTGVDPLASKYARHSPYSYAMNDPVFWNDPSGADVTWDDIFDIVDRLWNEVPMDPGGGGAGWSVGGGFTGGYGYEAAVSYGTAYNAMFGEGGGGSIVPTYGYRIVETSSSFSTQTWTGYKERYITGFTHKPGEQTGLAILIAFPDREADIPDNGDISDEVGSWFDDDDNGKLKVGHAGVVIVNPDGEGNNTYYFDYGRYGSDASKGKGRVRSSDYDGRLKVPNWKSNLTAEENVDRILKKISGQRKSGGVFENYGRIAAAVYGGLNYQAMYDYARSREAEGLTRFSCPFGNYCAKFGRQVVDAGGGWFGPHVFTGEQNVKSAGSKIYKID